MFCIFIFATIFLTTGMNVIYINDLNSLLALTSQSDLTTFPVPYKALLQSLSVSEHSSLQCSQKVFNDLFTWNRSQTSREAL